MTPAAAGRPLRFLLVIVVGWVGLRAAMLWPVRPAPGAKPPRLAMRPAMHPFVRPFAGAPVPQALARHAAVVPSRVSAGLSPASAGARDPARDPLALPGMIHLGPSVPPPVAALAPIMSPGTRAERLAAASPDASRWWGSAWLLVRGGSTVPQAGLGGGLLGGSQAGLRIGRVVDRARRLSLYGRVSAALSVPGRELAVGADWRPTALPVHVIAEQRVSLDGGRGGPTLGVVGGIGPVALSGNLRLEAYGEGGVILRGAGIGFADGAARISRHVARAGPADIALGAGAWGAAQPGAARVDLGPAVVVDLPVAGRHFRLSLDWRQRVAGDALPAAGPALTLGADF